MTANEFNALCSEAGISPDIALENQDVCAALDARNDEEVARILREEF